MKKFTLLLMPLMAISFLASCAKGGEEDTINYLCFTCNDEKGAALYYGFPDKLPHNRLTYTLPKLEYSTDKKTWHEVIEPSEATAISKIYDFRKDEKIFLRGDNPNGFAVDVDEDKKINFSFITPNVYEDTREKISDFSVSGNIMSIINKDNFETLDTLPCEQCFENLFYGCADITDASELLLPATTLTNDCYNSMFQMCTSLTIAPRLPATTLAKNCYWSMFCNCRSLRQIEVGFGELNKTIWPNATHSTYNWVFCTKGRSMPKDGTFIWNGSTDKEQLGKDGLFDSDLHIPKDWTVKNPS